MEGVLYSEPEKEVRLMDILRRMYELKFPDDEEHGVKRQRGPIGERNVMLWLLWIDEGERPEFPNRKNWHDMASVYRGDSGWYIEASWVNSWDIGLDSAISVVEKRMGEIAGDRQYKGVVKKYLNPIIPMRNRKRMVSELENAELGYIKCI